MIEIRELPKMNKQDLVKFILQAQEQLLETKNPRDCSSLTDLKQMLENFQDLKQRTNLEQLPVWYIESVNHTGGAFDMVDFTVGLRNRFTGETKEIGESVSHFRMCSQILLENYGGAHRLQQSILVTLVDSDTGEEWQKQFEIDHLEGEFCNE
jgi:hypothetical protein